MLTFNGTKDLFSDFDPVHVFYRNVVDAYRFFCQAAEEEEEARID